MRGTEKNRSGMSDTEDSPPRAEAEAEPEPAEDGALEDGEAKERSPAPG